MKIQTPPLRLKVVYIRNLVFFSFGFDPPPYGLFPQFVTFSFWNAPPSIFRSKIKKIHSYYIHIRNFLLKRFQKIFYTIHAMGLRVQHFLPHSPHSVYLEVWLEAFFWGMEWVNFVLQTSDSIKTFPIPRTSWVSPPCRGLAALDSKAERTQLVSFIPGKWLWCEFSQNLVINY